MKIASVESRSLAASDGRAGRCEGNLVVEGLEIGGVPARIDASGIHAEGETVVPGQDPNEQIAAALADSGITLGVAPGLGTCEGSAAGWSTSGLVVQVPTPAAGPLPPGHLVVVLAATAASADGIAADAAGDGADVLGDFVSTDTGGGLDGSAPILGDLVTRAPGPVSGGGVLPPVGGRSGGRVSDDVTGTFASAASDYSWDGVPLSLVLALLAAAALVAHRVRRYMQRLYALSASSAEEPV